MQKEFTYLDKKSMTTFRELWLAVPIRAVAPKTKGGNHHQSQSLNHSQCQFLPFAQQSYCNKTDSNLISLMTASLIIPLPHTHISITLISTLQKCPDSNMDAKIKSNNFLQSSHFFVHTFFHELSTRALSSRRPASSSAAFSAYRCLFAFEG